MEYDTKLLPLSIDFYQPIGLNQTSSTLLSDLILNETLPPSGIPFSGKYNIFGDLIVDIDYNMVSQVSKGLINLNSGSRVIINDGISFSINNFNIFGCEGWEGILLENDVTLNVVSCNIDDANVLFRFGDECQLIQSNSIYNNNTVTILLQDISNPSIITQFPSRIRNTERGIAASNVVGTVDVIGALNIADANVAVQAINSDVFFIVNWNTSVISGNIGVLLQYDGSFTGYNINLNGSTESTNPFLANTGVKSYLSNNSYLVLDNVEFTNWSSSIYNLNPGLFEVDISECQFQLNGSGITSIGNIGGSIVLAP